jgi:hypothetical protein
MVEVKRNWNRKNWEICFGERDTYGRAQPRLEVLALDGETAEEWNYLRPAQDDQQIEHRKNRQNRRFAWAVDLLGGTE